MKIKRRLLHDNHPIPELQIIEEFPWKSVGIGNMHMKIYDKVKSLWWEIIAQPSFGSIKYYYCRM